MRVECGGGRNTGACMHAHVPNPCPGVARFAWRAGADLAAKVADALHGGLAAAQDVGRHSTG